MTTVVLLGTFDSKGEEYAFLAAELRQRGVQIITVDAGVLAGPVFTPDIDARATAAAGGADLDALRGAHDRGEAVSAMSRGAGLILRRLYDEGRIDGCIAMGGTGGTALASGAFRGLPLGIPKVIVSTAASGDTRPYVGESDLTLIPSITDVSGINRISRHVLSSAAAAVAAMAALPRDPANDSRPLVGASMFGVTTPAVTTGRHLLEAAGFEVVVFHMTGVGGRTLENLIGDGWLAGVLDVTTTELADELVGGVFSAGPQRLTTAARLGVPQVVSVGALDMVNFGPMDTVPERFRKRLLYKHNDSVTLMRTTAAECAELGRRFARRLAASTGFCEVYLPLGGISAISIPGGPFHDPEADRALFDAIRAGLASTAVRVIETDAEINDPEFAGMMANRLVEVVQ